MSLVISTSIITVRDMDLLTKTFLPTFRFLHRVLLNLLFKKYLDERRRAWHLPPYLLVTKLRTLQVLAYEVRTVLRLRWISKTRNLRAVFYTKRSKYKSHLRYIGPGEQH